MEFGSGNMIDYMRDMKELENKLLKLQLLEKENLKLKEQLKSKSTRTEQDILKDFEELGWKVERGFEDYYKYNALTLSITYEDYYAKGDDLDKEIIINLDKHTYECGDMFYGVPEHLTMQEHKLLNELFTIWGWF